MRSLVLGEERAWFMGGRYSLREIYQLRDLISPCSRKSTARVFYWAGAPGLADYSGALWPVHLSREGQDSARSAHEVSYSCKEWSLVEVMSCTQCVGQGELVQSQASKEKRSAGDKESSGFMRFVVANEWGSPVPSEQIPEGAAGVGGNPLERQAVDWRNQTFSRFSAHSTNGSVFFRTTPFEGLRRHQKFQKARQAAVLYFMNRGYFNVEAPILVQSGGIERYLDVFETRYRDYHGREEIFQLPTSPEFSLKKLLVQGYPRVFSIAPCFRNGGELSDWHRPQFSMLEWYTAGQTLDGLIEQTFEFVRAVARALGSESFCSGAAPGLPEPLLVTVPELYSQHFNLDLTAVLESPQAFYEGVRARSTSVLQTDSWEDLFWKSFLDVIEPTFRELPCVFVSEFPAAFASLAAPSVRTGFSSRFEMFMYGVEICNGYFELTDSELMRSRFSSICAERSDLKRDADFEAAMDFGLQPCAGNALGLDRLVSVLSGQRALSHTAGLEPSSWGF
jgi:lysyl-tRNA synthetase class 2